MTVLVRLVLTVVLLALASGCYTVRASLPGALRDDLHDEEVVVIGQVDREVGHVFFLGGLVGGSTEDLLAAPLETAVVEAEADGVANLQVEARFTPLDFVISHVTLGLVSPRTYRVRADLVRIEAPPLPGRPLRRRRPLPEGGRP